jgi:hypothetical protein
MISFPVYEPKTCLSDSYPAKNRSRIRPILVCRNDSLNLPGFQRHIFSERRETYERPYDNSFDNDIHEALTGNQSKLST